MKATYIAIFATSFATVRSSYNTVLQHIPTDFLIGHPDAVDE